MSSNNTTPGHAFISYVREDRSTVDRVQKILETAGIPVWRDTEDLWPGEDWRIKIREAITNDALIFIACFSTASVAREKSYQNEELILAVDQMRLRPPGRPWLIPVRLSPCELPAFDLGAGRTLDNIQRVDLFEDNWDEGAIRLAIGASRAIPETSGAVASPTITEKQDVASRIKELLPQRERQIELEDLVSDETNQLFNKLTDRDRYPVQTSQLNNSFEGARFLVGQADQYWSDSTPMSEILATGCAWGEESHNAIWCRSIERVANSANEAGGLHALLDMQRFPLVQLMYAAGLACVNRQNFGALKAMTEARFRRLDSKIPVIGAMHVWTPFSNYELTAHMMALQSGGEAITEDMFDGLRTGRKGKRYTPVSDLLHDRLREPLRNVIADDIDYTETFDRLEVLLGALAVDAKTQAANSNHYTTGPWFGSFTWRSRMWSDKPDYEMAEEVTRYKNDWPPLQAGLFGKSFVRAADALTTFIEGADKARSSRF